MIPELAGRDVVLDSGAFTVWKSNGKKKIGIEQYGAFLRAWGHCLTACFALDVIGGTADQQLENLQRLHATGITVPVWPVFHEGDDWQLLAEYVRLGYKKVAIAGTVSRGRPSLLRWVWAVLERHPEIQYHGLGMTQEQMLITMKEVIDSVDSTTWIAARYGLPGIEHLLKRRSSHFYSAFSRILSPEQLRTVGRFMLEDMMGQLAGLEAAPLEVGLLPLFADLEPQQQTQATTPAADPAPCALVLFPGVPIPLFDDQDDSDVLDDFEDYCDRVGCEPDAVAWQIYMVQLDPWAMFETA